MIIRFLNLILTGSLIVVLSGSLQAQNIEDQYENLTERWLEVSAELRSYDGLSKFCTSPDYRTYSTNILKDLHHFDSVMIDFLNETTTELLIGHKEHQKALGDIDSFEEQYSNKAFISFLRESCIQRNQLEADKEKLKNDYVTNSFDGQVLVLERGLSKYMHHIDKRILSIEKHLHKIHPDRIGFGVTTNSAIE